MPLLAFKVQADVDKVIRLREEISKLKAEMKGVDAINSPAQFNTINQRLHQCRAEFNNITTEAMRAGAAVDNNFKRKIYDAQQTVNGLSEEIIEQKKVIAETSNELKILTDRYKEMRRKGQKMSADGMLPDINKARNALDEEKRALFDLTQERATAQLGVKKLREEYQLFNKDSKESTNALADMKSQLLGIGKGLLAGMGLKELASDIIRVRGQFQQADTAIATLLGSTDRAKELLGEVREYAKISPLEFGDITAATQMMLGFNIEAEKVPGFIKAIGDVSMGESSRFNSLTLAFSQMSATGKLMGQDLNQMINAGFNPLQVMSEKTGKSIAQLKEEMSKGAITSEMVQQAFIDATSAGGKFFNMSENAAKTINGQLSMMHDAIDSALNDIGTKSEGMIVGSISAITKLIESYETVGRVLLGLATTYGSYRTAVALCTFAQNGHTLAMSIARAQIILTQKAQALLNATMLANPYVLAAVALGGMLGVVIAASDGLNAAEKAQRDFNATLQEAQKKQSNYNAETEKAINLANNDAAATGDRQGAMDLLIKRYPTIIQKYIDEEGHLRNILQLKREIAEIDGQRAVQGYQNESARFSRYAYLADQVRKAQTGGTQLTAGEKKEWEEAKEFYFKDKNWSSKITDSATDIRDYFQKMSQKFSQQAEKQTAQNSVKRFQETLSSYTEAQLKQVQAALQKAKGKKGKTVFKGFDDLNGAVLNQGDIAGLDKYVEGLLKAKGDSVVNKDSLNKRKKKLQAELDALSVEEAAGRKGVALKKKIQDIDKQLGNYSATSKGGKGGTGVNADERKTDILNKQKIAQERAAQDIEISTREAQIKAMQDGSAKTIAQIELDKDKEMQAIERAYEDMRIKRVEEAKSLWDADAANKGKDFFKSDEYKKANVNTKAEEDNRAAKIAAANKQYRDALDSQNRAELQALRDYLKEYGTFKQQKLALAQEYAEKIRRAEEAGNTTEAMRLRKEQASMESGAKAREFARSLDFTQMLDGVGTIVKEIASQTYAKVQEYKKTDEYKNGSAENKKAIADLEARLIEKGGAGFASPFSAKTWDNIHNSAEKFRKALDKLDTKTQEHEQALREQELAEEALKNATNDAAKAMLQQKVDEAKKKVAVTGESQQKAEGEVVEAQGEVTNATTQAAQGLNDFNNALGNITSGSLQGFTDGIMSLISQLTGKNVDLTTLLGDKVGGIVGAIIGLIDALGDDPGTFLADLVDKIFALINGFLDQLFSGELVGKLVEAIIKGVTELIGNIVGMVANGGVYGMAFNILGGVFDGIVNGISKGLGFTEDTSEQVDAAIEASNTILESIDKNVDRIASEMKDSYGAEAISKYEELLGQYRNQGAQYNSQIQAAGWGKYGNSHTEWYYRNANGGEGAGGYVDRIRKAFGMEQGGYGTAWQGFFNQLQDMGTDGSRILSELRENANKFGGEWAELWHQINETGWDDEGRISRAANAWADSWGQMEESAKELREILAGTSFDDVFDDYMSRIYDFANGAEDAFDDVGDSWQEMVNKMVINNFAAQRLKNSLKSWYDKFSQAYDDRVISEKEIAALRAEYMGIVEDGKHEVEKLREMGIVDATESSKRDQQSATFNSAQSITHEDADSLVGIGLNHTMLMEQGNSSREILNNQVGVTNMNLEQINAKAEECRLIADETRDILANTYLEMKEANEHLSKIEKDVSIITSDVEVIKKEVKDMN